MLDEQQCEQRYDGLYFTYGRRKKRDKAREKRVRADARRTKELKAKAKDVVDNKDEPVFLSTWERSRRCGAMKMLRLMTNDAKENTYLLIDKL